MAVASVEWQMTHVVAREIKIEVRQMPQTNNRIA